MSPACFFKPILIVCITIKLVFIALVSANLLDVVDICTQRGPEGTAILESSPGGPEVLAIFKPQSVWLIRLETFTQHILNQERIGKKLPFIRRDNSLETRKIFAHYPEGDSRRIVSFYGLEPNHPFYNNILVFYDTQGYPNYKKLLRYRVDSVSLPEDTIRSGNVSLSATLISRHRSDLWKDFHFIRAIHTIRGSRLLVVSSQRWLMYVLNTQNLDNPIVHSILPKQGSEGKFFEEEFMFYLSVLDREGNGTLGLSFMRWSDGVCVNKKCLGLRSSFIDCGGDIDAYSRSFAYWLYHETEMTIRLLVFALHAILACNIIMAIIFVSSQMNKMLLLI